MKMLLRGSAAVAMIIAVSVSLAAVRSHAAPRKNVKYSIAINLPPSFLNEGSATIIKYTNGLGKAFKRKTGAELEWKILGDWSAVVKAVQSGKADFGALPAYYFAKTTINPKSGVNPFATYMSGGGIAAPFCMYVKRNGDFLTLDHLLNTSVAVSDEEDWVVLNHLFDANNLPFPPADFFEKVQVMTPESAFSALVLNKVDAVFANTISMEYILKGNRKGGQVAPIECSSTLTNPLIVHRDGLPQSELNRIEDVLLNMHKDSAFSDVRRFFKVTDGRWTPARKTFYSDWEGIVIEARKKGWDRQLAKIAANR